MNRAYVTDGVMYCQACSHKTDVHFTEIGCMADEPCDCTSDFTFVPDTPDTPDAPLTPYAGTSGWSGSETSKERAEAEDANGITAYRQQEVRELAILSAHQGVTVKEVRNVTGWHHGQASSALSVLHKEGVLARLKERRDRCQVYVMPEHVAGRDQTAHGRKKPAPTEAEQYALDHLAAKLSLSDSLGIGMTTVRTHEIKIALDYLRRISG